MRFAYLLALLFFALTAFGQLQNKIEQVIPPIYTGDRWDDFCLVNDTIGFVVTSNGSVFRTIDGFRSIAFKANFFSSYCRSVAFINDSVGFVGSIDQNDLSNLWETRDGGHTWTGVTLRLIANDTILPRGSYGVCGLAEAGNTVYACGAYYGRPFVARFNGLDEDWDFIAMDSFAFGLVDMHWINADTGFVTGKAINVNEGGIILHTQDGGLTWTKVFTSGTPMDIVWKLFPVNDSLIYAAIQSFAPYSARIAKSIDGGITWTQNLVDTANVELQGIGFINEMEGYTGGFFNGYYTTTDGGITWDFVNDTTVIKLNRFLKVKDQLLVSGASIYYVTDSSYVGIDAPKPTVLDVGLKILPNPTAGVFTLQIDLSQNVNGHILVYDIVGNILGKVAHQKWEPGQYNHQFDSSQYPVGTYYVGFITDYGNWFVPLVVSR